jgi:hypothetical protein
MAWLLALSALGTRPRSSPTPWPSASPSSSSASTGSGRAAPGRSFRRLLAEKAALLRARSPRSSPSRWRRALRGTEVFGAVPGLPRAARSPAASPSRPTSPPTTSGSPGGRCTCRRSTTRSSTSGRLDPRSSCQHGRGRRDLGVLAMAPSGGGPASPSCGSATSRAPRRFRAHGEAAHGERPLRVFPDGDRAAAVLGLVARVPRGQARQWAIVAVGSLAVVAVFGLMSHRQLAIWTDDRVQHAYVARHLTNPELLDDFTSRLLILEFLRGNEARWPRRRSPCAWRGTPRARMPKAARIIADKRRISATTGGQATWRSCRTRWGSDFARAGEFREANDHFEDALRMDDRFYQAAYDRALVLLRLGRADDALHSYLLSLRWASRPAGRVSAEGVPGQAHDPRRRARTQGPCTSGQRPDRALTFFGFAPRPRLPTIARDGTRRSPPPRSRSTTQAGWAGTRGA